MQGTPISWRDSAPLRATRGASRRCTRLRPQGVVIPCPHPIELLLSGRLAPAWVWLTPPPSTRTVAGGGPVCALSTTAYGRVGTGIAAVGSPVPVQTPVKRPCPVLVCGQATAEPSSVRVGPPTWRGTRLNSTSLMVHSVAIVAGAPNAKYASGLFQHDFTPSQSSFHFNEARSSAPAAVPPHSGSCRSRGSSCLPGSAELPLSSCPPCSCSA